MLNQFAVEIPRYQSTSVIPTSSDILKGQAFGTRMVYRKRFCKSSRVFFSTLPARIESMEQNHSSPTGKNKNQTPVQDQRCQSGPSAKKSVIPSEGDSSKNYGAYRSRNFTLTNSLTQQHLFVGREDSRLKYVLVHNFLRKLCCGSKKWRWLNQWMI